MSGPRVIILAGPNGAGKSTAAESVLHGALGVTEFVNADVIARGLSAFAPEKAAVQAGRIMLRRLDELAASGVDFAFETTLASRTFAPWIGRIVRERGYRFDLAYLWVSSPDLAVSRVRLRVASGGHGVPEETVRRRYLRGLRNLFTLYMPLASTWRVYDSSSDRLCVVAVGRRNRERVFRSSVWTAMKEAAHVA